MKTTAMTLAAFALFCGISQSASAQDKSTVKKFNYTGGKGVAGVFVRAAQDGGWREYQQVNNRLEGKHTFKLISDDGKRVVLRDATRSAVVIITGNAVYVSLPNVSGGAPVMKYRGSWEAQTRRPTTY